MIRTALALAMLLAPVAAQGQQISRADARAMPLTALAERYLGRPAPEFREVGLYNSNWGFRGGDPVSIVFAEAPRSSDFAGICEARTVTIRFQPPKDATSADAPLIQQPPEEGRRFRIIDTVPGDTLKADESARQNRDCMVGPVLPAGEWDNDGRYFPVFGKSAADLALFTRALRIAQDDARRRRHVPECWSDVMLPNDPMCQDPVRALANVSRQRVFQVSFYDGGDDKLTHAIFFFKRHPRETRGADFIQVEIDAYVHPNQEAQIEGVRIKGVTAVD